ncbi:MAG: hypothetical protein CO132_02315 [Candidatus Kerfeldbacteria bacterium CG_4_9_14_3_um_filter_45_8]|nr:MAG: hypothetical protein CO132_02315 [Candidatus Kerfeldbacteria bacterium CG_4_9_14_3_um_filter_45_8]
MLSRKKATSAGERPSKSRRKSLSLNLLKTDKRLLPIAIVCVVIAILTIGVYWITVLTGNQQDSLKRPSDSNIGIDIDSNVIPVEAPTTLPRRLDGVMVAASEANPVPACVMIENAAFGGVRPQSGLSQASLVYELIVEGGITRFMAVYAGENSERVGPVRSARDTYLEFVSEYNCAYFHAGGSYTALLAVQSFSLRDVDGLREGGFFWRESRKVSPHNLFTSTENLYTAIDNHSWTKEDPPNYDTWKFVDDDLLSEANETANVIKIGYGGSYDAGYTYNAEHKVYERSTGGQIQTDEVTGETITARNVIVQHVQDGFEIEGKGRINWPVTGEGKVDIFRDGSHILGTWKKDTRQSRTKYFDEAGAEIDLLRGNSWISIVPPFISFEFQ